MRNFILAGLMTAGVWGEVGAQAGPGAGSHAGAARPDFLSAATRSQVADAFAQQLAEDYAYPDVGAKMAAEIRKQLADGAYDRLTSRGEFAQALTADAQAVSHDLHIRVNATGPGMMIMMGPGRGTGSESSGITETQILPGNIGYLALDIQARQTDAVLREIAGAFALLHGTDALILDLRGNPGGMGHPELFLSYLLTGPPVVANTVHWRKDNRVQEFRTIDVGDQSYGTEKPVFVLVSRLTFSAAEALAYEIQSFRRGVIVGERTGGGANPSNGPGMPSLGDGFMANVPTGYVVSPKTDTNWEGVGVKPDVAVAAGEALGTAWKLAAERLQEEASDSGQKTLLHALTLAKLESSPSLGAEQIAGTYQGASEMARAKVAAKNGELDLEVTMPFRAEVPLAPEGGDRYRPATESPGFALIFFEEGGKVRLLRVDPRGPALMTKE